MQSNANNLAKSDRKLTPKQERIIAELLSHPTMKDACAAAGVSQSTLWRWLQDRDFHTAYMTARRDTVSHAVARLQSAASEAVDTLREVLKDNATIATARVSAAKAILDYSLKAIELEDLAQRVEELERLSDAQKK
jgi:hypothetical protein